jgi:hypothetical protein
MAPVTRATATKIKPPKPAKVRPLSAADKKVAAGLKAALRPISRAGLIAATPTSKVPKYDPASGLYRTPTGRPLVAVTLLRPPPGMMDGMFENALVDPSTNKFYITTVGGIAGFHRFSGPANLPEGSKFSAKSYTLAQVKELARIANK